MRALACLLAAGLLASGCSAQDSGGAGPTDRREPAATAGRVRTGLHVNCAGSGDPTIVLIAGLDTSGTTFADLSGRLAGTARTCFYDRPGVGLSPPLAGTDPDPSPGSAAADLRGTLAAEGVEPPYVLLGWSYGGLVAQAYAKSFPDDLAGLVLEDTSIREQFTVPRLADPGVDWAEGGRDIDQDALVVEVADPSFGDLPVVVLSQDSPAWWAVPFHRGHDRLARASTDGIHIIGVGSGHAMHEDVPGLVARAVRAVWAAAKSGAPLRPCPEVFASARARCRV